MSKLLDVMSMSVGFRDLEGRWLSVTDAVSFHIEDGEVFALVGESGCGKSVTAMGLLGLLPTPGARVLQGSAQFSGLDLLTLSREGLAQIRGQSIAVIFQEPAAALNPVMTIYAQLRECLHGFPGAEARVRIEAMLVRAGFSDVSRILRSYPHELSGGMLQRVMICMALLPKPSLLIADEPTTALDVTVQAQVMHLLKELCREQGTGLLLITHNLGLVAQYADRVAVMYAGRIVEESPVDVFLRGPAHPYSQGLLRAVPEGLDSVASLQPIPGSVPRPQDFVEGCRFANRCTKCTELCMQKPVSVPAGTDHWVSCFHPNLSGEES